MSEQKVIRAPGANVGELAGMVSNWFEGQGFETQTLEAPGGGFTVQARKPESWRAWVGMSAALNVTLTPQGENLVVQTGAAQWLDKATMGAVGALIFWPALIPAAYGAWKQSQLPKQIFQVIEQCVATGQATTGVVPQAAVAPRAPASGTLCPSCGKPVRAGAKFCDHCGATLQVSCAECGAALRPGAKFCDSCGAKV
jgi:membrane protease subunit (stomatin/prohibitin family)